MNTERDGLWPPLEINYDLLDVLSGFSERAAIEAKSALKNFGENSPEYRIFREYTEKIQGKFFDYLNKGDPAFRRMEDAWRLFFMQIR